MAGKNSTEWSTGNLSSWDTSKVTDMRYAFCSSGENASTWSIGKLTNWNTSSVTDMESMFDNCLSFNQDISNWNVSNVIYHGSMFSDCPIKAKYIPKFK
jgi:surface protein